ncbi:MAG: hypothetical protein ACYTEO_19145 [Planctomycetota bacterium]|jgi:hypothetical protein
MIGVNVRAKGTRRAQRALSRAPRDNLVLLKRMVEYAMDQIKGEVAHGDWFDHPTGRLQNTLEANEPQVVGNTVRQEGGWGVNYGRVLEFGPSVRYWRIRPIVAKALRFRVGDRIVYAKYADRRWTEDQLRPHWGKALDRAWPRITQTANRMLAPR